MDDTLKELNTLERTFAGFEKPSNLKLSLLKIITDNFSDELKIGEGGCGKVYKGILRNGIIAVKRLFNSHTIDDRMFHQEVQSLTMAKHKNTVRFLGYCSHTEGQAIDLDGKIILAEIRERLLCFEYLGNGSLEDHITGMKRHILQMS
nr:unnamed protein product [Digitaria exilis]